MIGGLCCGWLTALIVAATAGVAHRVPVRVVTHGASPRPKLVTPRSTPRFAPPPIQADLIPFGLVRRAETAGYVTRHYGSFMAPTWRLRDPRVIVIHYTDASLSSTLATFATDAPDSELHELPGTCAHYVVDTAGSIHELVPPTIICRHTVGLNWTAIGVEHVGFSDAQVLGNTSQLTAGLRLVRWLRCRFHIPVENVIGHNESLASRYHREDVAALRTQTHDDFNHADMGIYRARLRALGGCA